MKIELNLYASLRKYMPKKGGANSCIIEMDEEATIGDLLDQLQVPAEAPKLIFINGAHARREAILQDGDRVGVFPPVAGG